MPVSVCVLLRERKEEKEKEKQNLTNHGYVSPHVPELTRSIKRPLTLTVEY